MPTPLGYDTPSERQSVGGALTLLLSVVVWVLAVALISPLIGARNPASKARLAYTILVPFGAALAGVLLGVRYVRRGQNGCLLWIGIVLCAAMMVALVVFAFIVFISS